MIMVLLLKLTTFQFPVLKNKTYAFNWKVQKKKKNFFSEAECDPGTLYDPIL